MANLTLNTFTYNTATMVNFTDATMQDTVSSKGPMIVTIDGTAIQNYKGGIFNGACTTINHAVNVVGYAKTGQATPYYILRNSWGKSWGEVTFLTSTA